jgi:hypothetical protein
MRAIIDFKLLSCFGAARSTAPLQQRRCDKKTSPRKSGEACRDEESARVGVGIRCRHPTTLGVLVDLRGRLGATADDHDRRQSEQDSNQEQRVTKRLHVTRPNAWGHRTSDRGRGSDCCLKVKRSWWIRLSAGQGFGSPVCWAEPNQTSCGPKDGLAHPQVSPSRRRKKSTCRNGRLNSRKERSHGEILPCV